MSPTKYQLFLGGQEHFFKDALKVRAEILEPELKVEGWEYKPNFLTGREELSINTMPTASATVTAFGVVGVFLCGYFAEKLSDEFYERIAKRPIGNLVSALLGKLGIPEGKYLEYRDIVCFEDSDAIVVIRVIFTEGIAGDVDHALNVAHRMAHRQLVEGGKKAPIHCYKVVNGRVQDSPELFTSLEHIKNEEAAELMRSRGFKL